MLSTFPELLFLAPLSPFLIRLALASLFAYASLRHFVSKREEGVRTIGFAAGWIPALWIQPDGDIGASAGRMAFKILWVIEAVLALFLAGGAYVQLASIVGGVIAIEWLVSKRTRPVARGTAYLALVLCVSLLVTGAGALAFDLPL
ncbi:MAG TPA: hypothetical protein VJH33_03255 [Candidatus Paceibacterota bacterium]